MPDVLLQTRNLRKEFVIRKGAFGQHKFVLAALDGINLEIERGETLGMVGESGCGKSTFGLVVLQLHTPTDGQIILDGIDLTGKSDDKLRVHRRKMQMVFQDPFASLDPRLTVEEVICEPMEINGIDDGAKRRTEAGRLLDIVGLPHDAGERFPNEFSGGQQQRIGIARALALKPSLIICDEPVSALDVSVQAQILNLLKDLQEQFELSYLFISHDISVTGFMSRRIAVMYLGKIVEIAPSTDIINNPRHPYTQVLIAAVPEPDPQKKKDRAKLKGEVPSPVNRPSGCAFHPRCYMAQDVCSQKAPELSKIAEGHSVSCHFVK